MIKETTSKLREYLQSIMTKDMSAEELEKHQTALSSLDSLDNEEESYQNEIASCKDQIVRLVKSQGNANPPKEEQQPRSLEEIANAITGGK